jgi:uncharacterized repeat protein (TIGR01451 family)
MTISDQANWPIHTYQADYVSKLWQSEAYGQANLNGLEVLVTIQRGETLTDVSNFQRCGLTMLATTYRLWTVNVQVAGAPPVIAQVVAPDANARYLAPWSVLGFTSEFLDLGEGPGAYAVQFWDFQYLRESNPQWIRLSTLMTGEEYDGDGQDMGVHVVTVNGEDRVEFSNVPGNSYLPAQLPFSIAPSTSVAPDPAFLSISKTHRRSFARGQTNAAYSITVSNAIGAGTTVGMVTVTETIPSGLTLASMSGIGWTCGAGLCTRSDALSAGSSYPAITVAVSVAVDATSPQVNNVTVSGGGSESAIASDTTIILPRPGPRPGRPGRGWAR